MPTDKNQRADEQDASTRRTFLKTGALASVGTALSLGSGAASAETGANATVLQEGAKGLIFQNSFRPGARFVFTSGVVQWVPNVPKVQDKVRTNYQTRMIRYLNTNEQVSFFVARDANIGQFNDNLGFVTDQQDSQQPNIYEIDQEFTVFGDSSFLVTVNFSTIPENEETNILETTTGGNSSRVAAVGVAVPKRPAAVIRRAETSPTAVAKSATERQSPRRFSRGDRLRTDIAIAGAEDNAANRLRTSPIARSPTRHRRPSYEGP